MLQDVAILLLPTVGGALIANRLVKGMGRLEAISVGFPLGAGAVTWTLFVLSLVGVPLGVGLVWEVIILAFAIPLAASWSQIGRPSGESLSKRIFPLSPSLSDLADIVLLLGVLAILGAAVYVSIVSSYASWDAAAIWAAKGYGISFGRSIFAAERWGAHGLAYPLNVPLLISIFQSINGDLLPGSKLVFPLFLASAMVGLGCRASRHGPSKWIAVALVLLLGTTPFVFLHGTIGYADLTLATYLVLGVAWGVEAVHGGRWGSYLLSGILLGLGAWSRLEGIGYVILFVLVIAIVGFLTHRAKPRVLPWLVPLLIVMGPWFFLSVGSISQGQAGGALRGFWPKFLTGQFNFWELYLIPRLFLDRALDPRQWGVIWPLLAGILLLWLRRLNPREYPAVFAIACVALMAALVPVGLFYVQSFTRSDYYQLIERSFDRAFLPATFLTLYLAIRMVSSTNLAAPSPRDRGALGP